jgi:ferredoxin
MAPDLFDLDADGTLRVDADIASDRTAELQEIVDSCPRTALRLIP